jgi:Holliday junction DNA helicase RuvA
MIAGLDGTLEQINADSAIVKVAGISFQVYTPVSTLGRLGSPGEKVRLHTYLHLKEDATALYGFTMPHELDLFKMLITVSGVGPRSALSMLSSLSADELATAILSNNLDLITQAPGVGRKTASRLVLELKGKLEKGWGGMAGASPLADNADMIGALTGLGYSIADATRAAAAVPPSEDLTLEDRIRLALRHLARQ